ncbi:DUF4386 domain-containing protein [Aquimarina sp. D1M17]|uniref:DUF4386 domain-containing protein n=1 Tax=Aquimarina acroporae TaxID=2937283 RepID=UPI0020C11925|nr:DUF4386 domain-containing protein [Aquimarina acroporae]MCK8522029.1 DUF4386 domain-containing protein [Aquimarina acroporae]
MNLNPKIGRVLGCLFLTQFVLGVLINFHLLGPVIYDKDFLAIASSQSNIVITAVLLAVVLSGFGFWAALLLKPFFSIYKNSLALWYLGFSIIGFAITLVDNTVVLSILSVSNDYVQAHDSDTKLLKGFGNLILDMRGWVHMMDMLVGGISMMILYYGFCQTKLVPGLLSILGCAATLVMLGNVLWSIYGTGSMTLYLPVGLMQIAIAFWLIIKGFTLKKLVPDTV